MHLLGVCETATVKIYPFSKKIQVRIEQAIWGWSALYDQEGERGVMTARTSYSRWYLWACVCVWIGGVLPEQGCLQVSLTKNIQIQTLPVVLDVLELFM